MKTNFSSVPWLFLKLGKAGNSFESVTFSKSEHSLNIVFYSCFNEDQNVLWKKYTHSHYLNRNKFVRRTGQEQGQRQPFLRSIVLWIFSAICFGVLCLYYRHTFDWYIHIYFIYKYRCRKVNRRDNERQYSRGQATIEQTIGQTVIGSEQITRSTYFLMK